MRRRRQNRQEEIRTAPKRAARWVTGTASGITMPLLTALILCCSGPSETPPPLVRLVPEGLDERSLELGRVARPGFSAPVGDDISLRFTAPTEQARLWLGCGVSGDTGDVAFRALLRCSGADSQIILDRVATPGQWTEATADLSPYAGREVELLLRSEPRGPRGTEPVYWATPTVVTRTSEGPNILLICIDSLRADHLGCYGYSRPTSPTLDSLASAGCLFTRAVAQSSWTLPSVTSLFTSLHVASHGVYAKHTALAPKASTLAELLRQAGYLTAAFITAPTLVPAFGLDQGFDLYDARCSSASGRDNTRGVTNPCLHARALEHLETWRDARFFFVLHYWDVHYDYVPPPPYNTLFDPDYYGSVDGRDFPADERIRPGMPQRDLEHLVALYDGEIAHTDRYLAMLFRELRRLGLAENTVVVVTSDHGDEFLEHGAKGHGQALFQELIHVPLIWAEPGGRSNPSVVSDLVQLVDIAPTIMELVGVDVPADVEGTSLLGLIRGSRADPRPAVSELRQALNSPEQLRAILSGDSKIIYSPTKGWADAYQLDRDPAELRPVRPESIPHGPLLREAITSFGETGSPKLQVRVVGGGQPGRLVLRVASVDPILDVEAIDLEPEDALVVNRGRKLVEVRLRCIEGDIDGFALHLASEASSVDIDAWLEGERIPPDRVVLGRGEHPSSLPISLRSGDHRVQRPPEHPSQRAPSELPVVYIWVERQLNEGLAVERAEHEDDLSKQLRALGYVR